MQFEESSKFRNLYEVCMRGEFLEVFRLENASRFAHISQGWSHCIENEQLVLLHGLRECFQGLMQ